MKAIATAVVAVTTAALNFVPAPSAASEDDLTTAIAKCAVIAGQLDRLQCFDDAAKAAGLSGPQPDVAAAPSGSTGKWLVNQEKNPIDDSQTVELYLQADSGQSQFEGPVSFIARCMSNKTEAYINWGDYLGNDGDIDDSYKDVTIRIGEKPAVRQRWSISTDSKATFAPGKVISLLKAMSASNKFVAEVIPYDANPVTAIFDTSGMTGALVPLAQVCGWAPTALSSKAKKSLPAAKSSSTGF